MSELSESELEHLLTRLYPFGAEWTRRNRRGLAPVRDGIDFLASMRTQDEFWTALAPPDPAEPYPVDLAALRAILPTSGLASDAAAEDYLRSIGLTEDEIDAVVSGLDEPDSLDDAIRGAFAAGKPQSVARALERILETNSDVLATQSYVRRMAAGSAVARAFSAMMGIALLLFGAACGPSDPVPEPTPTATTTATTTTTTPAPTPDPVTGVEVPEPPPNPPTPPPEPAAETPEPVADPVQPPRPGPVRPQPGVPRYKGVSPQRRATRPLSA